MRFRVLGGVVAYNEQGQIPLGSPRQLAVLATLLVEPGTMVTIDQLVDRVWGPAPPQRARETLYSYLSRLRRVLGNAGGPIPVRRSGGYTLELDESAVDLFRFRALVEQARRAADDERAAPLWQEAMALWQGAPFAGVESDWLRAVAVELEAERLAAMLDHTDVLLRRGEHARLLPELSAAANAHPLDERLAGQLMLALYRCGRQADALAHYRLLHDRLVDELGSDPNPELRELHQRILRHEPELATAAPSQPPGSLAATAADPAPAGAAGPPPPPAQVPADVAGFTGRAADLRRLDELLAPPVDRGPAAAVVITAIGGTAGVGKTALAVHWAHQVADRFPDGQLYVNLRGYDPDQPVPPADALARFLTALGVPARDIPLYLDERAARYRSELAGRQMLIVLDNAASEAQVRPLLPGSGSCLVVVTSRDSLAGLVAVDGAHRLDLDLFTAGEAVGLLRRLIGARVEAEPEAAATLAEHCVRLPLALRIAAELAVSRPESTLADLTAELADRQARLELLDAGGDPYAAVREVFSWSIQHLTDAAVRVFRLLGLHPGPDLDPYAAAALADTDPGQARRMLALLARAHLLHRTGRGRYGVHDLLRAYATHLASSQETDQQREAAQHRLLDYYRAAAISAMDTLHPVEAQHWPKVPAPCTPIPALSEPEAARGWLEAERPCLVAIAAHGAAHGLSNYVLGLAQVLHRYLEDAHLTELLTINEHAYRAADQAGDLIGQAHTLRRLGRAYNRLSQHELALEHFQRALTRFRQTEDLSGEALTLTGIGGVNFRLGNHKQAIDDHLRCVELSRQTGDRLRESFGLTNLGAVEERLGRFSEAADHHRQALAIHQDLGSRYYEAQTLNNLACVELRQGQYEAAADHLRQSLTAIEQLASPFIEAHILGTLGSLHLHLGEPDPATAYFEQALAAFRRAGERGGQAVSVNGLGEAAQLAGRPADAMAQHTDALAIAIEADTRDQQARAHTGLGHAHRTLGDLDRARIHYEQSYALYTQLDMPDADDMCAYLGTLAHAASPRARDHRAASG